MKLNIIGVLFAAGVGLAVASPAQSPPGPEFGPWAVPALLIAGFAAGYCVRSLVSAGRHRRARRLQYGSLPSDDPTSHRLQTGGDKLAPP